MSCPDDCQCHTWGVPVEEFPAFPECYEHPDLTELMNEAVNRRGE